MTEVTRLVLGMREVIGILEATGIFRVIGFVGRVVGFSFVFLSLGFRELGLVERMRGRGGGVWGWYFFLGVDS